MKNPPNAIKGHEGFQPIPAIDRFWSKVDKNGLDGCWLWLGYPCGSGKGYGQLFVDGKKVRAHRFSYELFRKQIPKGKVLDHLCKITMCVNPNHLEAVTQRENTMRSNAPSAIHARQTACIWGHSLSGSNLHHDKKSGQRVCLKCRCRRNAARYKKRIKRENSPIASKD